MRKGLGERALGGSPGGARSLARMDGGEDSLRKRDALARDAALAEISLADASGSDKPSHPTSAERPLARGLVKRFWGGNRSVGARKFSG